MLKTFRVRDRQPAITIKKKKKEKKTLAIREVNAEGIDIELVVSVTSWMGRSRINGSCCVDSSSIAVSYSWVFFANALRRVIWTPFQISDY